MHNFYCVSINVATRLTTSTTISTGQLKVMEPYSYSNLILQRASTASGTLLRMFWDKLWRRNTLQISLWAQHWKRAFIMTLISNSSTPQSHELHDHSHMHPHPITQRSFTTMSLTPLTTVETFRHTRMLLLELQKRKRPFLLKIWLSWTTLPMTSSRRSNHLSVLLSLVTLHWKCFL